MKPYNFDLLYIVICGIAAAVLMATGKRLVKRGWKSGWVVYGIGACLLALAFWLVLVFPKP